MARGARASPSVVTSLPKVSFEKVEGDISTQPMGISDLQARSYGYNDGQDFKRPDSYIRHIEPLDWELAKQVEYDMDEQDKEWLDAINAERKKDQIGLITYEAFEIIMDRLEKEWFDMTKNLPKPDLALPSEDSTCAICDDSEGENSNAIVFCDGCNLAVHQDCYGVPYIPEGQWLCRKCTVSPENPVLCILCPNEGGAFKQTVHGDWVHLLCAIWVPETRVANDVFMEPITGVDKISKQRWKLKCSVCDIREGACIQCAKTSCFLAFHATCARKEKLLLPMKSTQGSEPVSLTCFCDRHLPKEQQDARIKALAADEAHAESSPSHNLKLSKSARAYAKTYKPGPPLVPAVIMERILHYITKISIRKKPDFLALVCRYWSLKREARRGAPLLKRLHLEPWTASTGGKIQTDEEKAMRLEQLKHLYDDLKQVSALAHIIERREQRKLHQAYCIRDILETCIFPHGRRLQDAFKRITAPDRLNFFRNPVSKIDVPDYFDIVKNPMCWSIIEDKLRRHEYWDLQGFKDDIDLVVNNAILYNKPGTAHYRMAVKVQANARPILDDLNHLSWHNHYQPQDAMDIDGPDGRRPPIGDLEPPLELLELLLSSEAVQDDLPIVLNDDPLNSLFSFELPREKPPPPPPPPPPPKLSRVKRDRKAEYERRKKEKEAAAESETQTRLDEVSLGISVPRTRRAAAAAAAFDAEVQPPAENEEKVVPSPESTKRVGRKRAQTDSSGQTDIPPMVDNVDNQASFDFFNRGWILPPGQRRGGRQPLEKVSEPRPRKRIRTEQSASRLSVFSTAASENQTLEQNPTDNEISPNDTFMNIQRPEVPEVAPYPIEEQKPIHSHILGEGFVSNSVIPPATLIQTANGTVIIEELDTPAIRREKSSRRREEKRRLAAQASLSNRDLLPSPRTLSGPGVPGPGYKWTPPTSSPGAGPSRLPKDEVFEMDSELSSLSEYAGEEAAPMSRLPTSALPPVSSSTPVDRSAVVLKDGKLEGGTLVWAKADTYPWWPAVIFEDDDPAVPSKVLASCKQLRTKTDEPVHILRFFDKNLTWQYLLPNKLKMFGEDEALDAEMIAQNSRWQKWKNPSVREECRNAYKKARAEMETGSEIAESDDEKMQEGVPVTTG